MVKFTRDEVKQFPFTTTTRPPPRYSCYSLFPFRKPVSFHFSSFSFPLLCSGSRSLSNFTLDSAPPFSSPFPRSFGKGFLFFPFSSLLFFTTTAFVQSVNTSNEAFVRSFFFFLPRVFFASLSTRPLLTQLPLLRLSSSPTPVVAFDELFNFFVSRGTGWWKKQEEF